MEQDLQLALTLALVVMRLLLTAMVGALGSIDGTLFRS